MYICVWYYITILRFIWFVTGSAPKCGTVLPRKKKHGRTNFTQPFGDSDANPFVTTNLKHRSAQGEIHLIRSAQLSTITVSQRVSLNPHVVASVCHQSRHPRSTWDQEWLTHQLAGCAWYQRQWRDGNRGRWDVTNDIHCCTTWWLGTECDLYVCLVLRWQRVDYNNRAYLKLQIAWAFNSSDPWYLKLDRIHTISKIDYTVLSQVSFSQGSYRHTFIPPTTTPHLTASRLFCHKFDKGTAKGLAELFFQGHNTQEGSDTPSKMLCSMCK